MVPYRKYTSEVENFRLSQTHMDDSFDVVVILNMDCEIGAAISIFLMLRFGWMRVCGAWETLSSRTPYICGVATQKDIIEALEYYSEKAVAKLRYFAGPKVVVIYQGVEIF